MEEKINTEISAIATELFPRRHNMGCNESKSNAQMLEKRITALLTAEKEKLLAELWGEINENIPLDITYKGIEQLFINFGMKEGK